jgi:hypothetical protein
MLHHRESNPRPSRFVAQCLNRCATTYPSINIGYHLIAQMFIKTFFVYFVIILPHVSAMTAILQGKFSYKGTHIVVNVVKDVHK